MKKIKHIVSGIVWTLICLYVLCIVLLRMSAVQSVVGDWTAKAISKKLGTKVQVGRVDLGMLNRLIVDDLMIYDQQQKMMLKASRLSVKIELIPLLSGRVSISSAQVFGLKAALYKQNADSEPNFQFVLDSLASKDKTKQETLDLKIQSLVFRNGSIAFDQFDEPPTPHRFNPNHFHLTDLSGHISIPKFNEKEVSISVKKLSAKESSGIDVRSLHFLASAKGSDAQIREFSLELPHSHIVIDSLTMNDYKGHNIYEEGRFHLDHTFFTTQLQTTFNLTDVAMFIPHFAKMDFPVNGKVSIAGNSKEIVINDLDLATENKSLNIKASGRVSQKTENEIVWSTHIGDLHADNNMISLIAETFSSTAQENDEIIKRIGTVDFSGNAQGIGKNFTAKGNLAVSAGKLSFDMEHDDDNLNVSLNTDNFDLHQLLNDERLGKITANLEAKGNILEKKIHANGIVSQINFNGHDINNLTIDGDFSEHSFDGTFAMDNAYGKIDMSGRLNWTQESPSAEITASILRLKAEEMGLKDLLGTGYFSTDFKANLNGKDLNTLDGNVTLTNLYMDSPSRGNYYLDELTLTASNSGNSHHLKLLSDFADIDMEGEYNYTTLLESIQNFVGNKLPSLPGIKKIKGIHDNKVSMTAVIKKSDWLQLFFDLPLQIDKAATITATLDEKSAIMQAKASVPNLSYNGSRYLGSQITVMSPNDSLRVTIETQRQMTDGKVMDLHAWIHAAHDELSTHFKWNDRQNSPIAGEIIFNTNFQKDQQGHSGIQVSFMPSEIWVNDTIWNVLPSEIYYSDKQLKVDNFTIKHADQHIIVKGTANDSPLDSLTAELKDVDVAYVMNIIDFHPVEFGGKASGSASLKAAFSKPQAQALLTVKEFRFEGGRMGTLYANAKYNPEEQQIDIDAIADDADFGGAKTLIKGNVSPERNDINLDIKAQGSRLEFVESFCSSFMQNVQAHAEGEVRLWGDLGELNLTGKLIANGELDISSLNTHYQLKNDTIDLVVNDILFRNDTIWDHAGNTGIVNGALHHDHLTDLTFDFNISAHNLLCYDFPDYGNDTFFGKVYADGTCTISGRDNRVDIEVNATPRKESFIEYNAASPDALTNQEFLTWRNKDSLVTHLSPSTSDVHQAHATYLSESNSATDLRINFLINTTTDATLRLLMDKASGDYITLNGTGVIRANYYNKGPFEMFGTYLIDHGLYRLTIQNFIKRDFIFQPGGTIVFGGEPYDAIINMPALYTINSVPLSDLQLGNSFTSNNVRVDCLMNITGTPNTPHVEFDIDLPTFNSDAKQMIRALINSEEEMNQQVIYLLGIGRFYTQNRNNAEQNAQQSQTSLAMQSLLSGTISQQINEVIKNYVNVNNWNFGANISTGDEGFNNAEYEGMLSGALLNNRLLINGQFGYRDNQNATSTFIGDFDVRYLLLPSGNLAVKVYNQNNDRYFTRNSLNTQGVALIMKKDFSSWKDLWGIKRKRQRKTLNKQ